MRKKILSTINSFNKEGTMNILRKEENSGDDAISKFGKSFDKASDKVIDKTAEITENGMNTIKKYPLHTAFIAGAVGLLVGVFAKRK